MSKPLFALVAIKDPERGKSRLASHLSVGQRAELNLWLANRALDCCVATIDPHCTVVITPCRPMATKAAALGMHVLGETVFGDVNATVSFAGRYAIDSGAGSLLFVPTDLPLLNPNALAQAMQILGQGPGCLIVPDHHGTGTNLLGFSPARADLFQFGEGSFERHLRLAMQSGLRARVYQHPALCFDIDTPEDYRDWRAMRARDGRHDEASKLRLDIVRQTAEAFGAEISLSSLAD